MATVQETQGCAECPLQKLKPEMNFVPPQRTESKRVAIGEGPGENEAREMRPFCGGSGKWLEFVYRKAGIKKDDVNLINVIQCRPSEENVFPTDSDARSYISKADADASVEHCLNAHVWPFLQERKWDRVDILGSKALEAVAKKDGGIYYWRGAPIVIPELGEKPIAIATLHPAALAREQQMLPAVVNDLRKSLQPPPEYYNLHPSIEQVRAFKATTFAFDIETAYWWGDAAKILCVGLSDKLYNAIVIPFQGEYVVELKRIFANAKCYIGQNSVSFDAPMLEKNGIMFNPDAEHHDTMLEHHLRFPDLSHDLESLGSFFTSKGVWKSGKKENLELYNCLSGETLVPSEMGLRAIKKIKVGEKVLTWEEGKGIFYAPVTRILKRRNSKVKWIALKIEGSLFEGGRWGKHKLVLTPNHQVLTRVGWKTASTLDVDEEILLPRKGSDSLIHGTLLGDGYAGEHGRLSFSQANRGWADAKANGLGAVTHRRETWDSFNSCKRRVAWEAELGISRDWRRRFYKDDRKKRFLPPPDDAALAVWYGDDGCIAGNAPRFACQAFPIQDVVDWFGAQFGVESVSVYNGENVALKGPARWKFFARIAPFLHPSMEYKLPSDFKGKYNEWMQQGVQWGRVSSKEVNYLPKRRGLKQMEYCLTVPETGCFFTADGLVANCRDVDVTFQVWKQLSPMVKQSGLWDLYSNVQIPLTRICRLMNDLGVKIDPSRVGEVRAKVKIESAELELKLPEHLRTHDITVRKRKLAPKGTLGKSGKPVKFIYDEVIEQESPWASPEVIKKYLYDELLLEKVYDLKSKKLTSGKMALDKLKGWCRRNNRPADSEAIGAIRLLRKKASILNLFAKESLAKAGTIHTSFLPHGTNSGRLSSSKPNLQNVTEAARCLYVPRHVGWSLIDIDFSSIESRLTAYLANDTDRLTKYLTIPDYSEHKYLASLITGCDYDDVVKDNSRDAPYGRAKAVVHGSNYGLGAKKMSLMNDTDFKETKELLDRWKGEIQKTVAWQNRTATQAKQEGYLTTPFGRKRWFYTSNAYTESLSFLPQSTAADIIFRCMIALIYERINWPLEKVAKVVQHIEPLPKPANLLLAVHDSLVLECPNEMLPQVIGVLVRVMTQSWPELAGFSIPVSIAVGPSWGETEKYTGPII